MHPELVLDGGPVLVVVSFRQAPAPLVAVLQRKLSAGSRAGAAEKPSPASEELERAAAAYRAGDLAEAEKHLRAAIRLAPNDLRAFEALGHFLFGRERFGDAIAPYERALELDKSTRLLDRNRRRLLIDQLGCPTGRAASLDNQTRGCGPAAPQGLERGATSRGRDMARDRIESPEVRANLPRRCLLRPQVLAPSFFRFAFQTSTVGASR
jgi:predicted Zn-dependent protease